jgi:hypothetical protein
VQDNSIVRVTSPLDHDVTHGHLCVKGRFGWQFVQNRDPGASRKLRPSDALAFTNMFAGLRRFLRSPADTLHGSDYKGAWNEAASNNAEDAILTGASAEEFERTGREDAEMIARHLVGGESVLDIGCGIGRIEKYLAPRVARCVPWTCRGA